jgi:hypothetical protein
MAGKSAIVRPLRVFGEDSLLTEVRVEVTVSAPNGLRTFEGTNEADALHQASQAFGELATVRVPARSVIR